MKESIPVIDISYAVENENLIFTGDPKIKELCDSLLDAFNEWGFIYIRNHGVSQEEIDGMFEESTRFFKLPTEEKNKVLMATDDSTHIVGYVPFGLEFFHANKPVDLKEAIDYMPIMDPKMKANAPQTLISVFDDFFKSCTNLTQLILKLINKALDIEDNDFLINTHSKIGKTGSTITLRSLYYPAVEKTDIKQDQTRCGEHTDYGSLTLLFQTADGLEVQSPSGKYIKANPIPGTIVINAADLLERWTSGKIKSTMHRVTLPDDTSKARQSIAFFVTPDNDCIIKCLDGSNKYEDILVFDYVNKRYKETYIQPNETQ